MAAAAARIAQLEAELAEARAQQAAIAIENARLFSELEQRNRDLNESLEQQTATAEILRIIATSPTDARPVLDAVVASAKRLSGSVHVAFNIREDDNLRVAAMSDRPPPSSPTTDALSCELRVASCEWTVRSRHQQRTRWQEGAR